MKKILIAIASCLYASSLFANNVLVFEPQTISQDNKNPQYKIKVTYPQIKTPSTTSEKNFNNVAKKWAIDRVDEFKKTIKEWNNANLPPELKASGSTLTVDYDLSTVDPKAIISLRYSADKYLVGAAHPSHVYSSINYDLINNKELTLSDIFQPNSPYLNEISKISTIKVQKKLNEAAKGQAEMFKEGLVPNAKNYNVWNLKPKGIQFTFNEYQVAAYVFGPQEILIPYQSIKKYISNTTPLFNCLKQNSCKIMLYKKPIE